MIKNDSTNNELNLIFYHSTNSGKNINIFSQKFQKEKENIISNESIKNIKKIKFMINQIKIIIKFMKNQKVSQT